MPNYFDFERETIRRLGGAGLNMGVFSPPNRGNRQTAEMQDTAEMPNTSDMSFMPRFPGFPEIHDYT